jgi:opacity protein-like surface antigen
VGKVLAIVASKIKNYKRGNKMKKFLFAAVLLVLFSSLAVAGDFPKAEVFAGYSFLNVNGQDDALKIYGARDFGGTGVAVVSVPTWLKRGFTASATYNLNQYFGIEVGFQRNADEILKIDRPANSATNSALKVRDNNFTFNIGPRLAFRKHKVITPFAHALFGVDYVSLTQHYEVNGVQNNAALTPPLKDTTDTGFGITLGGGVDVNVNKHLAIRMVQIDYIAGIHNGITVQNVVKDFHTNSMNLSFGVVFKFGGK